MSARFNTKPAATDVEKQYNSLTLEEQQNQMLSEGGVPTPQPQEQQSRFYSEKKKKSGSSNRGTQMVQLDSDDVTRITLRLDSELAESLKRQAKKESRSLNTIISLACKEYLSKR